jgi:paraquat-inducible protein A
LAYAIGALILLIVSNLFPIVGLQLNENRTDVALYRAISALFEQGEVPVGILVATTTMVVPTLELIAIIYMILPLKFGHIPPYFAQVYRAIHWSRPWGMIEVFMLGVLVSLVKLANFAEVVPGVALWSFGLLILLMAAVAFSFNPPELWAKFAKVSGRETTTTSKLALKPGRPSARRNGLMRCSSCGELHHEPGHITGLLRCVRCGARMHSRRLNSPERTWAFLAAAAVFYIPANLLPVMHTRSLLDSESDTIISGIMLLWRSGSWPLAILVFFASIVVPLMKLIVITFLLVTIGRRSRWRPKLRSKLHRFVEEIGRWSMLDIYVVTLLAALVQLRGLASVEVEHGAAAFAVVVVMTMFAAQSLDPRLIWDTIEEGHG